MNNSKCKVKVVRPNHQAGVECGHEIVPESDFCLFHAILIEDSEMREKARGRWSSSRRTTDGKIKISDPVTYERLLMKLVSAAREMRYELD